MNKEALQELAMGGALVLLAYAVYRQFKPAATLTATKAAAVAAPARGSPVSQVAQPAYEGSPFTALTNLLNGKTYDMGAYQGRNYLDEIADPAISGANGGKDSVYVHGVIPWD